MLIDELKQRMFAAIKAKSIVEKEILRTAIGEITSTGADPDDAKVLAVLKKMSKSCEDTLALTTDEAKKDVIRQELAILATFSPKSLSVDEILQELAAVTDQIRDAGNDGQATGVAMKHLKSAGANAAGKDVTLAVKQLRS
jgi:uncharacterized protein YqeY